VVVFKKKRSRLLVGRGGFSNLQASQRFPAVGCSDPQGPVCSPFAWLFPHVKAVGFGRWLWLWFWIWFWFWPWLLGSAVAFNSTPTANPRQTICSARISQSSSGGGGRWWHRSSRASHLCTLLAPVRQGWQGKAWWGEFRNRKMGFTPSLRSLSAPSSCPCRALAAARRCQHSQQLLTPASGPPSHQFQQAGLSAPAQSANNPVTT
jgi:hypothetical protein